MSNVIDTVEEAVVTGSKSLIGSMLGKVMIGVTLVLATLLGASILVVYHLQEENQKQAGTIAQRDLQLGQAAFQISRLQTSATSTQLFANAVNEQLNIIRSEKETATDKLESHRDKKTEEVVRKKPTLVERRINNASNSVLNDLQCATGGRCGSNTPVPSTKAASAKP
ncbi:Rz-like spanin [Pseudomonas phage vB_PpuM-Voja-6]